MPLMFSQFIFLILDIDVWGIKSIQLVSDY